MSINELSVIHFLYFAAFVKVVRIQVGKLNPFDWAAFSYWARSISDIRRGKTLLASPLGKRGRPILDFVDIGDRPSGLGEKRWISVSEKAGFALTSERADTTIGAELYLKTARGWKRARVENPFSVEQLR